MPRYFIRWLAAVPILAIVYFTWWLAGWAYVVAKPYLPGWEREPTIRVERVD
jgi:hypothetical protein